MVEAMKPYRLRYARYHGDYEKRCATIDDAVRFAAWGEEYGELSSREVIDHEGTVVLDHDALWERISALWEQQDAER